MASFPSNTIPTQKCFLFRSHTNLSRPIPAVASAAAFPGNPTLRSRIFPESSHFPSPCAAPRATITGQSRPLGRTRPRVGVPSLSWVAGRLLTVGWRHCTATQPTSGPASHPELFPRTSGVISAPAGSMLPYPPPTMSPKRPRSRPKVCHLQHSGMSCLDSRLDNDNGVHFRAYQRETLSCFQVINRILRLNANALVCLTLGNLILAPSPIHLWSRFSIGTRESSLANRRASATYGRGRPIAARYSIGPRRRRCYDDHSGLAASGADPSRPPPAPADGPAALDFQSRPARRERSSAAGWSVARSASGRRRRLLPGAVFSHFPSVVCQPCPILPADRAADGHCGRSRGGLLDWGHQKVTHDDRFRYRRRCVLVWSHLQTMLTNIIATDVEYPFVLLCFVLAQNASWDVSFVAFSFLRPVSLFHSSVFPLSLVLPLFLHYSPYSLPSEPSLTCGPLPRPPWTS